MRKPLSTDTAATGPPEALGESDTFLEFQQRVSRAAAVDRPVLIVGERGTGKELAARRLHYLSDRWEGPLVTLNCAALTPTLIESELFGYEAGAFTGARDRRTGRFEAADGGTLFLDEIASIPMEVQEKILRVVEYGVFERVGSTEAVRVDVRLLGATNANLAALADGGKFKRDLLDRVSFEVIFVPPLRERKGDVMLLARYFAARMAGELGREEVPEFSREAVCALTGYGWPGNVRELKNVVERAVFRSEDTVVTRIDFDPFRSPYASPPAEDGTGGEVAPDGSNGEGPAAASQPAATPLPQEPFYDVVRALEVRLLRRGLQEARHNQKEAARLLGLTYGQFRGLYRKYKDELA